MRIHFDRLALRATLAMLGSSVSSAAVGLTIFACEPEWAALAGELAPDAEIVSATHARQDPHYIEARPSLIAQLRRADLAVCTGAELESGWLPMLQNRAGNPAVRDGQPGMLYASESVALLDQRPGADRSEGHVHPEGNPHIHLDPDRVKQVAAELAKRLARIDPDRADAYAARHREWAMQWDQQLQSWAMLAPPLKGRSIVAQHSSFAYLLQWLQIEQIADLEPKPGLPPTPAHLASLVAQVRSAKPIAIVQALYQDTTPVRWLSQQTGIAALSLPSTVTDDGPSATLHGLYETLVRALLAAAEKAPG